MTGVDGVGKVGIVENRSGEGFFHGNRGGLLVVPVVVSASVMRARWRLGLLGRGMFLGMRTQGGVRARGTRPDLPWAMVFSPFRAAKRGEGTLQNGGTHWRSWWYSAVMR